MKTEYGRDTCTALFSTALPTIAKIEKQPKCPSTDGWIHIYICVYTHTHTHTHNGLLFSHEKEGNSATGDNTEEP